MTSATLASGKRVTLTMEEKSYLLKVDNRKRGVLDITSNSDASKTYPVEYNDDFQIVKCGCTGCKEHGRTRCAYRIAGARKLAEMKRNWYTEIFNIY